MATFLPTNASQVQQFAMALYGVQVGTNTMAQVQADITQIGGLSKALNSYFALSFSSLTTTQVADLMVANLGLTGVVATDAKTYLVATLNAAPASARGEAVQSALNLIATIPDTDAVYGAAAAAWRAKVAGAASYTGANNVTLEAGAGSIAQVFTLTTGANTINGTAGNDNISGTFDAVNDVTGVDPSTLTVFDSIDGGAGSDTLSIVATTAFTALPGGASVKNVENVVVKSSSGAVTLDTTTWGTAESVSVEAQAAVVGVTTKAASASVKGGTTVAVTDTSTTAANTGTTLTSVTVDGATDNATLTGKGITAVTAKNLVTAGKGVTVADLDTAHALTLTLSGVDSNTTVGAADAGTITFTDTEATSVAVVANTKASYDATVVAAKATAVTIDAAVALQLDALTAGVAKTVAISGAEAVTVSAHTLHADAVISSTNTKSVTITGDILATQTFTGGAGKDTISLATTGTKAITTGAGDDKVTVAGAFGTGGSVDAGEGTDTLSLTATLAANDSLSANTTFAGKISGFEKLELTTANVTKTVNLANLDNINYVVTAGATAVTLDNLASGGTVELTDTSTKVIAAVKDAATVTTDVLNVIAKATSSKNVGNVEAANVETVNLTLTDSNTTTAPAGTVVHTLALTDVAAKTITVGGNAGLSLTTTGATAVTSFDASASTVASTTAGADAKGVTWNTAALADAFATATDGTTTVTIKGTDGVDVISGAAVVDATVKLNITGGLGGKVGSTGDTLTGGAGDDTITASGLGNHILAGGAGKDAITGGSGNDTITGGAGADTLTGNGGNDIFAFTVAADSAPTGYDTIADFVAKTATVNGDVLQFAVDAFGGTTASLGAIYVADNGTLALAALSAVAPGDRVADKVFFALDKATGTLYVDGTGATAGTADGTADMAIVLTGVTTIDTNAITFA